MKKINLILADDHQLFREGLHALLNRFNELKVVAEVADGDALVDAIVENQPDVVLSDISMPGKTGIEVCALITQKFPNVKFIMLSMYNNEAFFANSLKAGAKGFLSKEVPKEELIRAIKTVYNGGEYYDKKISNVLIKEYIGQITKSDSSAQSHTLLSAREKQIIKLVAESHTNSEIADMLMISIRTVNAHKNNIMRKLNLKSNVDIVKYAVVNKIISL